MISNRKYVLTIVLLLVLAAGALFGGMQLGAKGFVYSGRDFRVINQNNAPKDVDYNLLWNVLSTLKDKDIDKPLDDQKLLYGAAQGLVAAVGDPYTTFFDPKELKDFQSQLSGSFEGIGAEVGLKNGGIAIVSPLDGSPAQKAGLVTGDLILKINDQDTAGMTLDEAVSKIRGPKGTAVKLNIFRNGADKPFDVTITRQTINVQSVKYSTKDDNGKKVEYIQISTFGDDTVSLFRQAANDAISKQVSGIIIDLRDDGGGYLQDAVDIASFWVQPGDLVVSEQHSDGSKMDYKAEGGNSLSRIPTLVMINDGTASAAEILAGALHDYNFAKLVGQKSFGKGSVQELVNLPQNTALKVTVAKWLTPKGMNLNHNGLDPDVAVARTPDQIQNNQDPQLDKALELLK